MSNISEKKYKIYPHVQNGRFYNHPNEPKKGVVSQSIRMLLDRFYSGHSYAAGELNHWISSSSHSERSSNLSITWIGHSTFLIQVSGYNILTDPLFNDLTFLYKRLTPPGIKLDKLPKIDYVLISHNHPDHMNSKTIKNLVRLQPNIKFLVPVGDKRWLNKWGITNVNEFTWWDNLIINSANTVEFCFLPAQHWSRRGLFDYNKSLWGSWMIRANGKAVYFAGDTAYSHHFHHIAKEFPVIDVALMPIAPCEPRESMRIAHVNAEEAGQAFLDLGAQHFIPMHWGTFNFGSDTFEGPYNRIMSWWNSAKLIDKQLSVLKIGQSITPSGRLIIPQLQVSQPELQFTNF